MLLESVREESWPQPKASFPCPAGVAHQPYQLLSYQFPADATRGFVIPAQPSCLKRQEWGKREKTKKGVEQCSEKPGILHHLNGSGSRECRANFPGLRAQSLLWHHRSWWSSPDASHREAPPSTASLGSIGLKFPMFGISLRQELREQFPLNGTAVPGSAAHTNPLFCCWKTGKQLHFQLYLVYLPEKFLLSRDVERICSVFQDAALVAEICLLLFLWKSAPNLTDLKCLREKFTLPVELALIVPTSHSGCRRRQEWDLGIGRGCRVERGSQGRMKPGLGISHEEYFRNESGGRKI